MASPSPIAGLSRGFSAYAEELREFFSTHHIAFGSPGDIVPFSESVSTPGSFQDEMASMMRSIILREGGNVPRSELLQLVSDAVGGPHFEESSQEYLQPVLKILSFLADVHRSRWGLAAEEQESAEAVSASPEPAPMRADIEPAVLAGAATVASAMPVFPALPRTDSVLETAAPAHSAREVYSRISAISPEHERPDAIGNLRAFPVAMSPARFAEKEDAAGVEAAPQPWMRRRAVWAVAACSILVLVAGGLLLHRRSVQDRDWVMQHVRPVSAPVSATASGPVKPTAYGPSLHSTKVASATGRPQGAAPSYGEGQLSAADGVSVASANQSATEHQQSWAPGGSLPAAPQDTPPAPIYRVSPAADGASYESPAEPVGSAAEEPAPAARRTPQMNRVVLATPLPPGRTFGRRALNVSSGVMAANVISAPAPEYPAVAKFVHMEGQVILQAVVSRNGTVVATHVLRGHRLLRGAATDAVSRWRFRPYMFNGRPTDVATIVTVDFRRSH